jgi:hypothetical protein
MSALPSTVSSPSIDVASLCRELSIGWTADDFAELQNEFAPYLAALSHYVSLGTEIPSHIPGTASICAPITSVTDPEVLFERAAGEVAAEKYRAEEYPDYWITVHFSTVPVVILLMKKDHQPLRKFNELREKCTREVGACVGPDTGSYFQLNLPKFGWTLHTDDEYEGVASRVHVPLITNRHNVFAWAPTLDSPREEWLLETYLEPGKIYEVRTDIPHTAINRDSKDARLHLILDVMPEAAAPKHEP